MKIAGFCSGHDCAFAILDNGIPVLHAELERYLRVKEPLGDSLQLFFDKYNKVDEVVHYTHCVDTWSGGIRERYPDTFEKMNQAIDKSGGSFYEPGHHESHAANAFYSSNFDEALIVTIDGGGRDLDTDGNVFITTFTIWSGEGNKIKPIMMIPDHKLNIGEMWNLCTEHIFGLSAGYPKGNQAGSVMAMAVMGNPEKYHSYFMKYAGKLNHTFDFKRLKQLAESSEEERLDIAAGLQSCTETIVRNIITKYMKKHNHKNLCLSGGVVLNSVMSGKMFDWFDDTIEDIYMCPVPYDAGLAIGAAQWVWHQVLENPRINWDTSPSAYLGEIYPPEEIHKALGQFEKEISYENVAEQDILNHLSEKKIVSVFGGGSESGRRALGNRSILADPRHPDMKDLINEKVKHRQWFRPFAPAILKEDVKDWFVRDIDSPYMGFVIKYKKDACDKVPAVVHYDGSGRLQTVTEKDNKWFYNLLKAWKKKTGVPILLNTSFNDREPIVETPTDAIKCFLKTQIDYLYFFEEGILVEKRNSDD